MSGYHLFIFYQNCFKREHTFTNMNQEIRSRMDTNFQQAQNSFYWMPDLSIPNQKTIT